MKLSNLSKEELFESIPTLIDTIDAKPESKFNLKFLWDGAETTIVITPIEEDQE